MYTASAVSSGVTPGEMLTSLIALTSVYGVLACVEIFLIIRFVRGGVEATMPHEPPEDEKSDETLSFAY